MVGRDECAAVLNRVAEYDPKGAIGAAVALLEWHHRRRDRPYAVGDPGPGTVLNSTHVALVNATPGAEVAGRRQWLQRMPAWMLRRLAGGGASPVPGGLVTLDPHVEAWRCRDCSHPFRDTHSRVHPRPTSPLRTERLDWLEHGSSGGMRSRLDWEDEARRECHTCGGVGYVFRGPAWPIFGPWRPGEYEVALRVP